MCENTNQENKHLGYLNYGCVENAETLEYFLFKGYLSNYNNLDSNIQDAYFLDLYFHTCTCHAKL
jgi:hypothetical protein